MYWESDKDNKINNKFAVTKKMFNLVAQYGNG
jgi:hypothetical protein